MIRKILLSLLILIAATSAAQAAEHQRSEPNFSERKATLAEVSNIRVGYGAGTIRIVVDMTKKVEFTESYVENPSRIIINLKDSWLNPTVKREIELKSLAAKKIRVAQFDPSTVRIVIESMAEIKPFHLDGGPKGHRFIIDIGNADFKPSPETDKPDDNAALKQKQEAELKAKQESELKAKQESELKAKQDAELKAKQEAELKAKQEAELKAKQEAELKAKQEAELKAQQEAELKAKQEAELKAKQERERELEQRERELEQRERELKEQEERELKEKQERELKEKQERELKEQQERERELEKREKELEKREKELKEKQERELKKKQERELKEKRERDIKEQREREKALKEKEKQERREKKEKEKREKEDEKTSEVDEPFKGLENDLGDITALKGKKIVIDPGHGGNDAGAIGPTGVMEKTVTLKVSLELKRLLEAEGATVILTREGDTTVSEKGAKASDIEELGARCDVANRNKADIFISIHADAFTRPEARGTTSYYYSKSTSGRGQKLADCIRRNLVEQLGTPSRGTQPCNFYVVKNTDMPATLIELGFISNKEEEKLLDSKEGVQKAAQGILDGIEDYFG
ncbi:MAG: N-acetylmuramoyl-L-alanine amidase [Quinella sp. 3Q1]|nr:N-acetylmuramoyl-L-alanine amidase [Quinella sp. 3Q1]